MSIGRVTFRAGETSDEEEAADGEYERLWDRAEGSMEFMARAALVASVRKEERLDERLLIGAKYVEARRVTGTTRRLRPNTCHLSRRSSCSQLRRLITSGSVTFRSLSTIVAS